MVFVVAGICFPSHVVLCHRPVFWELLPQGSKGAFWSSSMRHCCFDMHSGCYHHLGCSVVFEIAVDAIHLYRHVHHSSHTCEDDESLVFLDGIGFSADTASYVVTSLYIVNGYYI